ncbi:MAG: hypothetical protein OQL10_10945 [Sedimenticola sp.]|uniref:Uncharacterized protein n=1 Tax=Sedimenticola thiotaurini TaxID=1543721 RepID=A0A558CMP7_9GAMM|nr:hypothetical protein [Sedimenticola sp.]MCW8976224.1 hypothetical protein [Sedimenticola sp.]TVT50047.1 MAG: hypothetical protein FHK82_16635 [Sedimenticola thiotaurini]
MAKIKNMGWLLAILSLLPVWSVADSLEGRLNGLDCASHGEMCPTDKDDPHVLLERDFVVQTEDGNYFFITNMDWRTKLQYVLSMVKVEGKRSEKLMVISADEFWVKQENGEYQLKWSLDMAREAEKQRKLKASETSR